MIVDVKLLVVKNMVIGDFIYILGYVMMYLGEY